MGDLLSNGLHKKVMICYIIVILLKVDYTYSFLKNPLGNGHWPTDERKGV